MDPLTYKQSGVDIEAAEAAVRRIAPLAKSTFRPEVLGEIGAFAGFVTLPAGYREPVLVSSTDGVGSKLKIAFLADRHDTGGAGGLAAPWSGGRPPSCRTSTLPASTTWQGSASAWPRRAGSSTARR